MVELVGTGSFAAEVDVYICNLCHKTHFLRKGDRYNYCPHCGADFLYEGDDE